MQRKVSLRIPLSIISLVLFGVLFFGCAQSQSEIRVYGIETDLISIENLSDLEALLLKYALGIESNILLKNNKDEAVVVKDADFSNLKLQNKGGKYTLLDSDDQTLLNNVNFIFLPPQTLDVGLYHIDYTTQRKHYEAHELMLQNFNVDKDYSEFQVGTLSKSYKDFSIPFKSESVLMVFGSGEERWFTIGASGEIVIGSDITFKDGSFYYKNKLLKALWENPPNYSNREIYSLIKKTLETQSVMAIFIDGLGYNLWNYAKEEKVTNTYPEMVVNPARAVFPPRTIYNYYAFGTGDLLNDQYSPAKEIFADKIFQEKNGKIIEGQTQVYSSPTRQILNVPDKSDGDVDRIIFETAKDNIDDECEFLFIHFHEVDDRAHWYGPHNELVMEAIENVGSYITELQKLWDGKIFLFSDHGLHGYYNESLDMMHGTHYAAVTDDIVSIFVELQ